VRVEEPAYNEEEANLQRALELSLKEQWERTQGPARPVVLREPDSGRIQPLLDVQGKGKEKVVDEQAVHDLLTLQTLKKKSPADQFIFHSEMESDNEVPKINTGDQDEARLDQTLSSHVVLAGPNLEHMDLEATDALTQQKPEQMDEESTTTTYPNVQENLKLPTEDQVILKEPASSPGTLYSLQNLEKDLSFIDQFFIEKPQEEETGKTNVEVERIGELEQHMTDLIQNNLALEERLDKQGNRLYNLENLNIPHKVSQEVDEIVTDAVDWAMQAPLRARFKDLPTVDMKEILQQWMFDDNSYKADDVHNDLYEALQKSLDLEYSNQCLADQGRLIKREDRDVTYQELLLGLHLYSHLLHLLQQAHLVL
ncbi:retrovirus-related pol polyprotein from transposon TNT 1-94, partial [Tanacetum coccineum]